MAKITFKKWLLRELKKEAHIFSFDDTAKEVNRKRRALKLTFPESDFAGDVKADFKFPDVVETAEELTDYLVDTRHACDAALKAGLSAFKKWRKEVPAKKVKPEKHDGLNADDIERIKKALRQAWSWSHSRRLVVNRCTDKHGFAKCEQCKKKSPKIFVDHIKPVGTFDGEYIERLFVPSDQMQGLCAKCHKSKTEVDLINIKRAKIEVGDFF